MKTTIAILTLTIALAGITSAREFKVIARWQPEHVQLTHLPTGKTWTESYATFHRKCGGKHPNQLGVKVIDERKAKAKQQPDNEPPLPRLLEVGEPHLLLPSTLPESVTLLEASRSMAMRQEPKAAWYHEQLRQMEPEAPKPPPVAKPRESPILPKTQPMMAATITESYDVRKRAVITAARMNQLLEGELAGQGQAFIDAGRINGICPIFLAGVAMHETGNGKSRIVREKKNAFGIYKEGKYVAFDTVEDSIHYTAAMIAGRGYVKDPRTPRYTIANIQRRYCPIGDNDPGNLNKHWRGGVISQMRRFYGPNIYVIASL